MSKKLQRVIVVLLAAVLLLTVIMPAVTIFAQATVTQQDIDKIKDQLSDVSSRKKDIQSQLASVRNDLSQAKEAVELVQEQVLLTEQQIEYTQQLIDRTQEQIDASQVQIDASQAQIEEYDVQIAQKESDIRDLEQQEADQYREFYDQVRWMEETGAVSYLSILFEAASFAEMLDYATLIGDIMDYSNRIIDRLVATQEELAAARDQLQTDRDAQAEVKVQLENQKAELEAQKAEHESQKAQLQSQKTQLDKDKADATALLNQIAASESSYAKEAAELAAEEAAVQKALKEAEKKYKDQLAALENNNNASSGEWGWPLQGYYYITSLFGGRTSPITGKWETHTGTDIPAPRGTPILAPKDGVVTYVNSSPYHYHGWYCIIDHGNGYTTLYAHQNQKPIVKEGQTVKKGDVIGYVGTTGNSTGYHLHYELSINGVRGTVLQLYPNTTFTYKKNGKMYTFKGANYTW